MATATLPLTPTGLLQPKGLDTCNELTGDHFDALAELAALTLQMPIALINFIDRGQFWCKAAWGAERAKISSEECLCMAAVESGDALVIHDTLCDSRFSDHPVVVSGARVRFYAAIVICLPGGPPLGTLCVLDYRARMFDDSSLRTLRKFTQQVVNLLEGQLARQAVCRLHDRLDRARANRDQFLTMLAHELRAPLAPISTAVQTLQQSEITKEQRISAKMVIDRHVQHMSQMVNHMLLASVVSSGDVELMLEAVPAKIVVDDAIEMSSSLIRSNDLAFTLSITTDPWVNVDRTQCSLIISNLLSNAAKYTPRGGQINLTVEHLNSMVEIRVLDSGIGIADEEQEEIFEVFGQSQQPLDRAKGGIGLGLALARRLAEKQGGSIKVRSAGHGKGSEFILTLQSAKKVANETTAAKTALDKTLDIVIVDDNVDAADALGLYYKITGHTTRIAYCAQDAIAMMLQRQPDAVISDIGLPNIDGYELVKRLVKINPMSRTAFVAVTGYTGDAARKKAFAAGFDAHFSKPVNLKALDSELAFLTQSK